MTQVNHWQSLEELYQRDLKASPPCSHRWMESIYAHRSMPSSIQRVWSHTCLSLSKLASEASLDVQRELNAESLLAIGDQLVLYVQEDMDRAALPFHNCLHLCDALISASHINEIWYEKSCASNTDVPEWHSFDAAVLLFSILVHDWGHDGGPIDRKPSLEALSINRVKNALGTKLYLDGSLISLVDELISPLILSTDPRDVEQLHQKWIISNSPDLWLQVLITECDVAASLMANLGPYLSQCLLLEKANWEHENLSFETLNVNAASKSWRQFIRTAQVSSPCADALGWKTLCRVGSS
jgi:hypothetical protein